MDSENLSAAGSGDAGGSDRTDELHRSKSEGGGRRGVKGTTCNNLNCVQSTFFTIPEVI